MLKKYFQVTHILCEIWDSHGHEYDVYNLRGREQWSFVDRYESSIFLVKIGAPGSSKTFVPIKSHNITSQKAISFPDLNILNLLIIPMTAMRFS